MALVATVGGPYGRSRDNGSASLVAWTLGVVDGESGPEQWTAAVQRKGRVWRWGYGYASSCAWACCAGMSPLRSSAPKGSTNAILGFLP